MLNAELSERIAQAVLELAKNMPSSGEFDFYAGCVYFYKFKRWEVNKLSQVFREQFVEQGSTVHLRVDYDNGAMRYTIRYRNSVYFVEVTGHSLLAVKAEFIEQVNLRYGEGESVSTVAFNVDNGAEVARLSYKSNRLDN